MKRVLNTRPVRRTGTASFDPRPDQPLRSRDPIVAFARGTLYIGLVLVSLTTFRVGGDGITVGDVFILVSLGVAALTRLTSSTRMTLPVGSFLCALLVVVGGLLATGSAVLPESSLTVLLRLLLVALALPWLMRWVLVKTSQVQNAIFATALGGGICGAGTIIQYLFGASAIPGTALTNAGRYSGFAQHVSDTGGITAVAFVLAIGLIAVGKGRVRVLSVGIVLGAGIGLVLSGSVSGMTAAAIGLIVLVIRRALSVPVALMTALGVGLAYSLGTLIQSSTSNALSPYERILQTLGLSAGGRYSTSDIRMETYAVAWERIASQPWGYGLDTASGIVDGTFPAHNFFIASLFQGGILLALGLCVIIVRSFRLVLRFGGGSPQVSVALAGASAALVFALSAPSIFNRYFWVPVALLVACTYVWRGRPHVPESDPTVARS